MEGDLPISSRALRLLEDLRDEWAELDRRIKAYDDELMLLTREDEMARRQEALQLAERVHRRLVAWRWMAMRYPEVYRDIEGALAESQQLNEWIEAVLATRPSGRILGAAGDTAAPDARGKRTRTERSGATSQPSGTGRRPGRRAGSARSR